MAKAAALEAKFKALKDDIERKVEAKYEAKYKAQIAHLQARLQIKLDPDLIKRLDEKATKLEQERQEAIERRVRAEADARLETMEQQLRKAAGTVEQQLEAAKRELETANRELEAAKRGRSASKKKAKRELAAAEEKAREEVVRITAELDKAKLKKYSSGSKNRAVENAVKENQAQMARIKAEYEQKVEDAITAADQKVLEIQEKLQRFEQNATHKKHSSGSIRKAVDAAKKEADAEIRRITEETKAELENFKHEMKEAFEAKHKAEQTKELLAKAYERQMRGEIKKHDDRKAEKAAIRIIERKAKEEKEKERILKKRNLITILGYRKSYKPQEIKQNKIPSPSGFFTKIRRVFRKKTPNKKTPNPAQYIKYEPAKLADTASIERQLIALRTPPIDRTPLVDRTPLDVNMPKLMRGELP
jgi:hypothetical protein